MREKATKKFTPIQVFGEVLITAGGLVLLYLIYSLWLTNFQSDSVKLQLVGQLKREWQMPTSDFVDQVSQAPASTSSSETVTLQKSEPVSAFALAYVPRLKSDVWAEPVVEGVSDRALAIGVGHYPETALPGEIGNFAIAGHRATNGEPFARFENLEPGDKVFIRTKDYWFEYELIADQIVQPNEVWVLSQMPSPLELSEPSSLITLTTCDPRYNSHQRWVWWGELVAGYPASDIPEEIARG